MLFVQLCFHKNNNLEEILIKQNKSTFGGDVMNVAAIIYQD